MFSGFCCFVTCLKCQLCDKSFKDKICLSELFIENGRIPGWSNEENLGDVIHIQDVFRDFCDKTGQIPKDKVADAVRCLGENPLQSEVTQFF